MRKLLVASLWVVGLGCGGENSLTPGSDESSNDPVICVGDPDSQMICRRASEFWDCTQMPNGDKKCVHKDTQQPPGGGAWSCTQVGGKIVCTTSTPNAPVPGGSGWTCTSSGGTTTCEKEGPVPPGGGSWTCTLQEFSWTCAGTGIPGGSGAGNGTSGGSTGGGSTPGVCTQWYAVKWGIGGSTVGGCDAIPGNTQDCEAIRKLLNGGVPGPLTNGVCTVAPVRVGDNWVVTLPSGCQFLPEGVCGKYGGNTFFSGSGSNTVTIPAQQGTGLSHFEFMWCC